MFTYSRLCVLLSRESVYPLFKRLGTELVLGLFLNVSPEETPELFEEITGLCTLHWHGELSLSRHTVFSFYSTFFKAYILSHKRRRTGQFTSKRREKERETEMQTRCWRERGWGVEVGTVVNKQTVAKNVKTNISRNTLTEGHILCLYFDWPKSLSMVHVKLEIGLGKWVKKKIGPHFSGRGTEQLK